MTAPSSFNVSGLLGGMAGSIDVTSLVSQLMQAQALPQTMLKNQLSVQQTTLSAYQAVNTKMTAVQTAAQVFTDVLSTVWQSTAASSSNSAVVATSDSTAQPGSSTFSVTSLAAAQISTVAADASGNVVSSPSAGIDIGTTHIALTSGSATDVAAAINAAGVGVRAAVIQVDNGQGGFTPVLQMSASTTGTQAAFTASGFSSPVQQVVQATNAQITVGDPTNGGYTITSQSNTFTGAIPGVTFSVNALASNVTVSVQNDSTAISNKVQALVSAVNAATTMIGQTTAKGAVLEGSYDVTSMQQALYSSVSASNVSLKTYGIDMDSTGQLSFDATAFAAAYSKDPVGTKAAINAFASALNATSTAAVDPTSGTVTAAIASANGQITDLNSRISDWTTRLADIQTRLTAKYNAMEIALGKLQSQSTYLTSMLKSMSGSTSNSNS